jgi:hypothetical protein
LISKATLVCNWEGFWKPSNAREEVILPHITFPFHRTGVVDVGWGVLEACVLFANEGFDIVRRLVFHLVKLRVETPCCEVGINPPVCPQELLL